MDNLAHTLAGAALGEAGLKHRTALAIPTLLIGANLPDVDVLSILFGSSLGFRRGWTHGILAIVVLPVFLTGVMLAWDRWVRRRREPGAPRASGRQLLLLAYLSVLTHPFLDWLNTYGMRWLMPFDGTWFYGDALFIVDPWVWLILLGGIIAARERGGTAAGRAALSLTGIYIVLMLLVTEVGTRMVENGMSDRGISIDDLMVGPVPVNPNSREVVMRRGDTYYQGTLRWLPTPRLVVSGTVVRSNRSHPAAEAASRSAAAEEFLLWSRFPFYSIEPFGAGYRVVLDDLRYSDGVSPSWAAVEVILRNAGPGGGTLTSSPSAETGAELGT